MVVTSRVAKGRSSDLHEQIPREQEGDRRPGSVLLTRRGSFGDTYLMQHHAAGAPQVPLPLDGVGPEAFERVPRRPLLVCRCISRTWARSGLRRSSSAFVATATRLAPEATATARRGDHLMSVSEGDCHTSSAESR
jgi:hypothetical protein